MIVVFEGPDGCGKSTLLSAVRDCLVAAGLGCRTYACPRRPAGVPMLSAVESFVTHAVYAALAAAHGCAGFPYLLVDRLWDSDVVYERVTGRSRYDRSYAVPRRDFGHDAAVVYVAVRDWKTLADRRGGSEVAYPYLQQLHREYEALYSCPRPYRVLRADGDAADVRAEAARVARWVAAP